jgi:hypothetical protein
MKMKKNLLRLKLLFVAAVLTVMALPNRPAAAFCRIGQYFTFDEQECISLCDSKGCPHYAYADNICTCSNS